MVVTRATLVEPLEPRRLLTRLAVVGDFSANLQVAPVHDVSELVKSWSPDGVLTVGDNNYPVGAASTIDPNIGQWYHSFISPYLGSYGAGSADGQNHYWPALGNHDWGTPNAQPYLDYFTLPHNERYYAVQIGDIAVFVIDSDDREPDGNTVGSLQANWIRDQMLASTAKWKLVTFHHAPYSSSSLHGSSPWMQWPFADWGATAVISGHDHTYERLTVGGLTYFVDGLGGESIYGFAAPAAGSVVRYNGDYGAMRIDSTPTAITFHFVNRAGAVIDTYTIDSTNPPVDWIAAGSTWKYLDNGTNQGAAWRAGSFDDSSWQSGPAQLGYGDGDEATVVSFGSDTNQKYLTTYFRKSFTVATGAAVKELVLGVLRDDGAVIYVNGTEVLRTNMPGGPITSTTKASVAIEDSGYYTTLVDPALLVSGTNVIAAEVHQASVSDPDLSFDLKLTATPAPPPFAWMTGSTLHVDFGRTGGEAITLGRSRADLTAQYGAAPALTFPGVSTIEVAGTGDADTLHIADPMSAPLYFDNGAGDDVLRILAGASAVIGSIADPLDFAVEGSATLAQTLTVASLAVTGRLDVADHALFIDYGLNRSPLGAVTDLIRSARNGGSWDGPGIASSLASGNFTSLGVADRNGRVIVRYTYGGDANLDGRIDVEDYGIIDFNVSAGFSATWSRGDFNYDGKIDVDDYGIIDFNVVVQGPRLPVPQTASPLLGPGGFRHLPQRYRSLTEGMHPAQAGYRA